MYAADASSIGGPYCEAMSDEWLYYDGRSSRRTIQSWAKDQRFVDVVQLEHPDGSCSYAVFTPEGMEPLEATTDDGAVLAIDPDLVDGLALVTWEEAFDGEGEQRLLDSWSNDLGYVDTVQTRLVDSSYDEEGDSPPVYELSYWSISADFRDPVEADTDDGAIGRTATDMVMPDMKRDL